jgi:hypothetical protein
MTVSKALDGTGILPMRRTGEPPAQVQLLKKKSNNGNWLVLVY